MALPTPHVPNVSTLEGVIDLFMLCINMELGDLINPLMYKKKYWHNQDCDYDQLCTIHACGLARDLCNWWHRHYLFYEIQAQHCMDGKVLFRDLFSQQIKALISYKKLAERKNIHGNELECTAQIFESLVMKYFPHAATPHRIPETGFEWVGKRCVVQPQMGNITSSTGPSEYSSFMNYFFYN